MSFKGLMSEGIVVMFTDAFILNSVLLADELFY